MKWTNKGHELDVQAAQLIERFGENVGFYVFGAGTQGKELARLLNKYSCLAGIIDNSLKKQGIDYCGKLVIGLDDYIRINNKKWIIIAASSSNTAIIKGQLEKKGLRYKSDFWTYEEFLNEILPVFSVYHFSKSFIPLAQISLTERCTLKCKKCAHGCFAVSPSSSDLSLSDVYLSADSFFGKVDYVNEFVLIGGEPLLYKDIGVVIEYIGSRYRNRINIFSITTNGTILPSEELLLKCREYGVIFRISNYSHVLPKLNELYSRLTRHLSDYGIEYYLDTGELQWMDYGFEYKKRNREAAELMSVFDTCKTPCREVRGNRLYFCVMARSVSDNLHYNVGEQDYLDLDELHGIEGKKVLLEYVCGYSEKGYLEMCDYCNGAEAVNYPVPAAEQWEKSEGM